MKFPRWLPLVAMWLAAPAGADDNFRCGKWIATRDLPVSELLAKCGEPASRESRIEDLLARNANTGLMFKTGEQLVEVWTYERGANAAPMVVTIVDGRIKSIERAPAHSRNSRP
jgi:hypothetical protein